MEVNKNRCAREDVIPDDLDVMWNEGRHVFLKWDMFRVAVHGSVPVCNEGSPCFVFGQHLARRTSGGCGEGH